MAIKFYKCESQIFISTSNDRCKASEKGDSDGRCGPTGPGLCPVTNMVLAVNPGIFSSGSYSLQQTFGTPFSDALLFFIGRNSSK